MDKECCKPQNNKKTLLKGISFGLIPHMGCIVFIILSIAGVTIFSSILKPILYNQYFFYSLIIMSFIFATISVLLYLKKQSSLNIKGIKSNWKYLSILFGATIIVNLLMFTMVFPYATNAITNNRITGDSIYNQDKILTIKTDIPCTGHAPLITEDLYAVKGIDNVKFEAPNKFTINYNPKITSQEKILDIETFKFFPASLIN